ncbi:hypothetical protein [Subdoligranulum variabile]|uniref:Tat pathway signal sequence domain protein n=1 Tax=Subdoligranulum variabile DSM 15176 TaxID=411471 RepID=D1PMH1_9FIRM|nr:hypothetical protein [Subdoligranulum variabile]EFB75756.1 hypothetical protein SUBVAR_05531 [Subdoligranulum variabile DSM 15176]UWP68448.1 hypothetical protein NQ490_00920 [Subdoligranulum variabile]
MAVSIAYLLLFLAAGFLVAWRILPDADGALLLPLGCSYGLSMLAVFPALFALLFGFGELAAVCAAIPVLVILLYALYGSAPLHRIHHSTDHGAMWICLAPLLLVTVYLLHTHILHAVDGTLHTGQSCYGDLPMHLGFIEYIAQSGQFPPAYPLLGGDHRFGYPFLCETVSSVFRVLGADQRTAYLLPMLPAVFAVFGMFWQLARRVLGSVAKASLAFYLFFLGSGFGFAYFLGSPEDFQSIFTGFYTTPTNYTVKNIVWVNPIVDLMIPQRATLFGWSLLLPALHLLWRFCYEEERRLWLPLAFLVLPLPLTHTHSALALVLVCLVGGAYTLLHAPHTRVVLLPWGGLALLCGVAWLAQMLPTVLAQSVDGQNMLRLHFNWVNNTGDGTLKDNYFWFYIKNIGIVYLLLIPAWFHASRKQRWFYGGGLLIWALAEIVVFQPNTYDNNKLLYVWHMLGCLLVAQLIVDFLASLRRVWARLAAACVVCFLGMFGSVLTIGREVVSDYQHWSADEIALAAFVSQNAESDALFLTSDRHTAPVFALAGRRILCGSGSYVYYHGMDYASEYHAMHTLYEAPDEATLSAWGIDYVVFDPSVTSEFSADENWYAACYPLWYDNDSCRVYKISS